jgi:transposase
VAYLPSKNFQTDLSVGGSFKDTPSRAFVSGGISYRLDKHSDKLKPIEDQEPKIGRKDMRKNKTDSPNSSKKKDKKKKKKESSDIDW